jgi:predicted small lipoprotein YifL
MIAALVSAAALTTALAGCGKTGELMQPAPLFGAKAKADYDAQQRANAAADAARRAQPEPASQDPTDQPLTQAPYAQSIPGSPSPFGQPPGGAMGNPGTTPDR